MRFQFLLFLCLTSASAAMADAVAAAWSVFFAGSPAAAAPAEDVKALLE